MSCDDRTAPEIEVPTIDIGEKDEILTALGYSEFEITTTDSTGNTITLTVAGATTGG